MRRRRDAGWIGTTVFALILLAVGTILGRALPLGPLSLRIGFTPVSVNLYVLSLSLALNTNVLGLVGAAAGLLLARFL